MSNLIGQSLGRYHITEQLGEGGMATVYKAFDTRLETDVAVKVIRTERLAPEILEKSLKRFEREAKSLAKLTHPNIVKVTDYGEHEGRPYLVMPYLPGGTLKERLKSGAIPWQEAVQLLLPIAHALEYAHEHNLIHRDVKPSNILLTDKGQPMLTDFGVAKLFDVDETAELTGTGMGIGTPEYMAPEQWTGHVTPQTDIYALGVVFYEMVTGRKPYQADTPAALLLKQANDPLPRPRSFVSGLPDAVEKVLFKALAKGLGDRYQGMGDMVKALEGLLAGKPVKEARPARRVKEETLTAVEFDLGEKTQVDEKLIVREKSTRRGWVWGVVGIGISILILVVALASASSVFNLFSMETATELSFTQPTTSPVPSKTPEPTATLEPALAISIGSTYIRPQDSMVMVYVPAGEFIMGSNNDEENEKPMHSVFLDAYWIDKTEITNSQYALCVSAGICSLPEAANYTARPEYFGYYGDPKYDDFPVVYVTWENARAYCKWTGGNLPTEAQWEKAARGTDGRIFPWGNDAPNKDLANYESNGTVQVANYPLGVSPYGAFDMAGNAWEWVADLFDETYYQSSPTANPTGPIFGRSRIARGGGWSESEHFLRSSFRGVVIEASDTDETVGFRCARSAEMTEVLPALSTPVSSETSTGEIIYANAVVNSPEGGGANLRAQPAGAFLVTLDNGTPVELLGATQEVSGVTWVKVAAVKNGNQIEGWVMQSVLEFPTPTPTPTP